MNSCRFGRFGGLSLCVSCCTGMRVDLNGFAIIFEIFISFVLSLLSCCGTDSGYSCRLRRWLLIFGGSFNGISKDKYEREY
jgi:hypothetical protein